MKRILLFLAIIGSFCATAQPGTPSLPNTAPNPYVWTGQMLNTSNSHVGQRNDTSTNSTPLYLYINKINTAGLPVVYPMYNQGTISVLVSGIGISGTPAGSITLEESFDGSSWAQVRMSGAAIPVSTTSGTVTTTYTNADAYAIANNTSATQSYSWSMPFLPAPYLRVKVLGTGTQTSSWQAWYCLNIAHTK